ncbi:MAG: TonB family protein [Motiliproteus sp.]|nr:TonB family protein [Motiliproteus sp.]MCW9054265.1 TonB family protein [Motiliproteus sp.]
MKGYFAIDGIGPWLLCSALAHGVLVSELPWFDSSAEIAVSSGSGPLHVSLVTPVPSQESEKVTETKSISNLTPPIPSHDSVKKQRVQSATAEVAKVVSSTSQTASFAVLQPVLNTKSDTGDFSLSREENSKVQENSAHRISMPKNSNSKLPERTKPAKMAKAEKKPVQTIEHTDRRAKLDNSQSKPEPIVVAEQLPANPVVPVKPKPATSISSIQEIAEDNSTPSAETSPIASAVESLDSTGAGLVTGQDHWKRQAKGALALALGERFSYPRKARKRNWQGEVLLQVSLNIDGSISQVQLVQSSGHGLLDRDAIRSIESIGQLALAELDRELQIQIPVSYQLTDR